MNHISEHVTDSMAVHVPVRTKFLYGMGLFGTQFFNGVQSAATAWFWLDKRGLDPFYYFIIMSIIYNIWNTFNDPIFGWISDRTRTRWGRRIPYIRFLTPIWLIATIFLFLPSLSTDQISMAIWFMVFIIIFDGCYTMVAGCYNSLMPELTTLTTERTRINLLAQIFGMLAIGVSFIFPLMLEDNESGFFMFVIIGGLIALTVLVVPSFFIRERMVFEEKPLDLLSALKNSIKNKPFLAFVGWNFMVQFTTSMVLANIIIYAKYVLRSTGLQSFLVAGALFGTIIPGFFIASYLGKRKGVRFTVLLSSFIIATALLLLFLSESYWMAIASLALAGFGLAGAMVFTNVMIAESIDFDEIKTNQRREAMFFGTNALLTKPAIGIAQGVLALTFVLTGYVADINPELQLPSAIFGIRMIMGLFPSIALFISLLFIYFYPTQRQIQNMKYQLSMLHSPSEPK